MYYTWITENVAIGELSCKYDSFDIVINLAYINKSFNRGLDHRKYRVKDDIYEFGLYDSDGDKDYFEEIVEFIIPRLINCRDKKILFHCQSGKSRSVSLCLAYFCIAESISFDDAFSLIKSKRDIVNPRKCFLDVVKNCIIKMKNG